MKTIKRFAVISTLLLSVCVIACEFLAPSSVSSKQDSTENKCDSTSIEIPSKLLDRAEQILYRSAYTVSYNKDMRIPNWVAWKETSAYANGKIPRKSSLSFREDEQVPTPRATLNDYKKSGWDRGHMYPAGDAKWSNQAMYESFLLTNICPQNKTLNTGDWEQIESLSRQWAKKYGEIYIVCGPIVYDEKYKTIGANKVVIPDAFFKVILCLNPQPKAIAFICENAPNNYPIKQYVTTVDEVERITRMDFFPLLEDNIEEQVESISNLKKW